MSEYRVDLPMPLPDPDGLADRERRWYALLNSADQERIRRTAVQYAMLRGHNWAAPSMQDVVQVAMAFETTPFVSERDEAS
jgi:hypothetical protein